MRKFCIKMKNSENRSYFSINWIATILLIGITIASSSTNASISKNPMKKRSLVMFNKNEDTSDEATNIQKQLNSSPLKRTFCNAFTGCGRKRSDNSIPASPSMPKQYEFDRGDGSFDENNGGLVAVDDIARDILAEARLWEAFQAQNSIRPPFRRQLGFFPTREKRNVQLQHKINELNGSMEQDEVDLKEK